MKTIRQLSEKFSYDFFEKFASLVSRDMGDTEFLGVRVFDDKEGFVRGTIVYSTALLYIHYVKEGDERADRTLDALNKFIDIATSATCRTWGKFSLLRGLTYLYDAGLIDKIRPELIEKCKASTDYTDFFDKATLRVINLPSNYIQVALACAGLREKIGFDKEIYSSTIIDTLISVMKDSPDGWMDEAPPYKRFDRYSFLVTSELSDTLALAGIEFPEIFEKNLRLAAGHSLFMANKAGDGWNYGRSLSCHGDCAVAEVLASALARGLISEDKKHLALSYIAKITEKTLSFWFDKDRGSFNIWWDGRSTNRYRQVHRVMQVGLDMCIHLLTTLKNLEAAGLADVTPDESLIPSPAAWEYDEILFSKDEHHTASAVALRYGDILSLIPLTGIGDRYMNSSYLPYPAVCGKVEAAPESNMPFLTPEYERAGIKYRPCQYFKDISISKNNDTVSIKATGELAIIGEGLPVPSGIPFKIDYSFLADTITVEFFTEEKFDTARLITGTHGDGTEISAFGFDNAKTVFENPCPMAFASFNINRATADELQYYDYMTPHGFITHAVEYTKAAPTALSYKIKL